MTDQVRKFARGSLWLLPIWAVLLFLATFTEQPDPQTAFADFAGYVSTNQFLLTHLVGSIVGAALGAIGVVGLMLWLQDTRVAGKAIIGMAATVAGNMLMTSVYGVAAFAQPVMGRLFLEGQQIAVDFYNQTYGAPLFVTALTGLLLFLIGGVFIGLSIAGSGRFPRWAGWVYAIGAAGFALGLFFPAVVQNITSALLIVSTLAVAWRAGRKDITPSVEVGMGPAS